MSLSKHFKLGDHGRLEARVEAFNVANRVDFALPENRIDFPGAGRATSTRLPARTVQFGFKYNF